MLASFLKVVKVDDAAASNNNNKTQQTHTTTTTTSSPSPYYKAGKEYYQPITVRFRAASGAGAGAGAGVGVGTGVGGGTVGGDGHSVLQCLFRWVKPQEEVRKYMEEVMDRAEPAEEVELAARLPREGVVVQQVQGVQEGAGTGVGGDGGKAVVKESVERVGTPVGERDRKRKRVR